MIFVPTVRIKIQGTAWIATSLFLMKMSLLVLMQCQLFGARIANSAISIRILQCIAGDTASRQNQTFTAETGWKVMKMELIDRKAFRQKLIDLVKEYEGCKPPEFSESYAFWVAEQDMIYSILDRLEEELTIDAIPLINGHWLDASRINRLLNTNAPVVHCHHCGISFIGLANSKGFVYKYCPHCGKRTDGEAE